MSRELIYSLSKKDFILQTFRSGGKGGQNQNKRDTGVRIIHKESGAVGESREERSQLQNKRKAFKRLIEHPKFKVWHALKVAEWRRKKSLEALVDEEMRPENLKIEVKNEEGKWVEEKAI